MAPNTLLITTDQHRWDWLGCHGTTGVETPNLDALAARGVRFTHHVTNSSLCVPARIGLGTGVAPIKLGTLRNDDVLPDDVSTYYQHLRDAGYLVGAVGKLDLNKPAQDIGRDGNRPDTYRWGFTHPVEIEGKMHAGLTDLDHPLGPYGWWLKEQGLFEPFVADYVDRMTEIIHANHRDPSEPPLDTTLWFSDSVLPTEAFADSYIGARSRQWLREVPDGSPFHLFVSFVGPHDPFDPPSEYAERFRDASVPPPTLTERTFRPPPIRGREYGNSEEQLMAARRQYTASLALIDDQIGEILETLSDEGLAEDTIVIFSADHGEMLGDRRLFQKNVPYDPAMRVPFIAAGPGIATGICDALTEHVDLTATLVDLAGVAPMPGTDGTTLVPQLSDPSLPHRDAAAVCDEHARILRTRTHKYVHHPTPGWESDELYDLTADPDELINLIDDDPETASDLREQLVGIIGLDGLSFSSR